MQHLFLSKELSLLAKEKGFDEPCYGTYRISDGKLLALPATDIEGNAIEWTDYQWRNSKIHPSGCAAPLYQQIVDWFREKHNILIEVRSSIIGIYYFVVVPIVPFILDGRETEVIKPVPYSIEDYKEYYEALNKAIEEAFKLLTD